MIVGGAICRAPFFRLLLDIHHPQRPEAGADGARRQGRDGPIRPDMVGGNAAPRQKMMQAFLVRPKPSYQKDDWLMLGGLLGFPAHDGGGTVCGHRTLACGRVSVWTRRTAA